VGSYLFAEIQGTLVKHWRSKDFQIFIYLDDGAGADQEVKAISLVLVSYSEEVRGKEVLH